MKTVVQGADKLKEETLALIAAKRLVVYSWWLDLNNLSLMLLGIALELAAAWFFFRYDAGGTAGNVAIGGLICQILSIIGWYGSPDAIANGQPQGGIKTLLFTVRNPFALCAVSVSLRCRCNAIILGKSGHAYTNAKTRSAVLLAVFWHHASR